MTGEPLRERLLLLRDQLRTAIAAAAGDIEASWVHLLASCEICISALDRDDDAQGEQ
jgi:hypothetical protein